MKKTKAKVGFDGDDTMRLERGLSEDDRHEIRLKDGKVDTMVPRGKFAV